jgi:glutaredoxin
VKQHCLFKAVPSIKKDKVMLKHLQNIGIFVLTISVGLLIGGYGKGFLQGGNISPIEQGDFTAFFAEAKTDVILFSRSTCQYCAKTKALLSDLNIEYKEFVLDQSDEGADLYNALDVNLVPVILVGDKQLNGFSESDIRETFKS